MAARERDSTVKRRTVLLALCLMGTPAWAPAGGDIDAVPIEPVSNRRVQRAIDQRSDEMAGRRVICRRERETGTHISRTVCRTVAQIEDERATVKELLREYEGATPVNP